MDEVEWDSSKRESNLAKHGIDFADIGGIFSDPNLIEARDGRHDYGEDRFRVVGQVEGEILFVAYTWRGTKRRLISARKANRDERQIYQDRKASA